MAPIEQDVKNQQPILPGKQWATLEGKTTKATVGRQNKNSTTEGKIKLCQSLGMTSRKNALVRIMVGGC